MTFKQSLIPFFLFAFLAVSLFSGATDIKTMPDPADGKAVVTDYINAIGGLDAIKKISSLKDTGSFSVQGMTFPVVQKHLAPNKTLQIVTMNGTTVGKSVFDGSKGYTEQMGTRMDMGEAEMADMKTHTSVIPQADYLTSSDYKLSLLGSEKVDNEDTYKILVTTPSGTTDTEYYSKASKLLIKQIVTKTVNGQTITITNSFNDYRKTGAVLLPYKQSVTVASGAINQSIDIAFSDMKINEGVSAADFE
jgi:zinc protease